MKLSPDPQNDSGPGWPTGLGILVVGVLIGSLARPADWLERWAPARVPVGALRPEPDLAPTELQRPMARGEAPPVPRDNGLQTLTFELDEEAARRLQAVHDRSVASGLIVQEEGDLVPATVRLGDRSVRADVRIKGDYLDHLSGDKWSLRVELKGDKLMGMSRFSVQHPKTRGYLWEWLIMEASRREGLLAPRATFVNVVVNDNDVGMFYLEEHFTKELLESQGRREGPIVRFDETVAMDTEEQYAGQQAAIPPTVRRSTFVTNAEISAFGEKRLAQTDDLARQLEEALDQMRAIQLDVLLSTEYVGASAEAKIQAIEEASRTVDEVLDVDLASRMHALMALFRCKHGMAWKNRRFYHNPVTGRLEPIVFDTLAGLPIGERDPTAMYTHTSRAFLRSDGYHNGLFRHVARLAHPDYLRQLFEEYEDELRLYSELMAAEGIVDPQSDVDEIKDRLYDQQVYLRELIRPKNAVNFDCRLLSHSGEDANTGDVVVEAWTTTEVPVVVRGFHFSNGRFLPARSVLGLRGSGIGRLLGDQVLFEGREGVSRVKEEPDAVVLPHDGRRTTFRFPNDVRLSTLRDVQEEKQAALSASEVDRSFQLQVEIEYRFLTEDEARRELLWIRRFDEEWALEGGRPIPASAAKTLERHPFLSYREQDAELVVQPGAWDVDGDLVVPDGFRLRAGPGVELRFSQGNGLVSGEPLFLEGTAEAPILLGPRAGSPSWAGVVVLSAAQPCVWRHVRVRDTDVFARGGWIMTGGVVFYRTPVQLYDVLFADAHGEDALNIFGADFLMERVTVDGCASDAFDGDFVKGTVRDSLFKRSVEDGVDVSGSDVDVVGCRFVEIGDKAVSAGENSVVGVRDCVVESAAIGIAAKDFSRVEVERVEIRSAIHYGLALYIKKPEFGASTLRATDVTIGTTGRGPHLVQETCTLELNGNAIQGIPVDVKEMYRLKILGQ